MKNMLKGDKIFLRALEPTDFDTLLKWENDSQYWPVSNTLTPFSKHLLHQYVNSAQDIYTVKQIRLIIVETTSGLSAGAIDLFDFNPRHQHTGVGILVDDKFRRKGYALEAVSLIKNYALNTVGIRNLTATITSDNPSSISLFEKSGFEKSGCLKKWFNQGGKWLDEYIYQCQLV
ncbi:MAG: GNAT family N-acetyltransferase [Crocinitomicaceae bacterium]|nr:GNAT family N-acetyltransferase [Crocinitomicaceae bacterium]